MFGVVPKGVWQRDIPCDNRNRIAMGCQSLLLQREGRCILIDAGLGTKLSEESRESYATEEDPPEGLSGSLQRLGLSAAEITDVIITHLHFDHAGGLTYKDQEEKLRPTFPNARHWIQAQHLDWARSDAEKQRGSFPAENIEPLAAADLFSLVRGEQELFRDLSLLVLHGHTKAMQAVLINGERPLFFATDLLPTRAHLRSSCVMAYDIEPLKTLREKQRYLELAADNGWLVYLQHEPSATWGPIERFRGDYRLGRL